VLNQIAILLGIVTDRATTGNLSWYSTYRAPRLKFCLPHWTPRSQGSRGISAQEAKKLRERSFAYFIAAIFDIHNNLRNTESFLSSPDEGRKKMQALFKEYGWGNEKARRSKKAKRTNNPANNALALALMDPSSSSSDSD